MEKTELTETSCLPEAHVVSQTIGNTLAGLTIRRKKRSLNRLGRPPAMAGRETMRKIHSLTVAVMLFVVMLACAPLAAAQQGTPAGLPGWGPLQQQQMTLSPTPADLEQFRDDLTQALQQMDQHRAVLRQNKVVREALDQSKLPSAPPVAEVKLQLQQMTHEELAQAYKAFATAFPNWREAPQALGSIAGKIGGQQLEGKAAGTVTTNAVSPDRCQDAFNAAPSWTDWGVTKAFEIAAQGAYEIIPPPFNAIAMAAWIPLAEGANAAEILNLMYDRCSGDRDHQELLTAISNLQTSANTIVSNANTNTTSILNSLSTAKNEIVNNDNSNRTTIVNNDNANTTTLTTAIGAAQTTINTTTNASRDVLLGNITTTKNEIVANDNSNRTTITNAITTAQTAILNNANANKNELRDLMLRTQIEADLAENDGGSPVALYLTPNANGGYLDLVQSIVTQTLANIRAAGGDIGNAQSSLNQANADKAAGRFKDAYKEYRKAYKAASN